MSPAGFRVCVPFSSSKTGKPTPEGVGGRLSGAAPSQALRRLEARRRMGLAVPRKNGHWPWKFWRLERDRGSGVLRDSPSLSQPPGGLTLKTPLPGCADGPRACPEVRKVHRGRGGSTRSVLSQRKGQRDCQPPDGEGGNPASRLIPGGIRGVLGTAGHPRRADTPAKPRRVLKAGPRISPHFLRNPRRGIAREMGPRAIALSKQSLVCLRASLLAE